MSVTKDWVPWREMCAHSSIGVLHSSVAVVVGAEGKVLF